MSTALRPVHEVQVDTVDAEPSQAALRLRDGVLGTGINLVATNTSSRATPLSWRALPTLSSSRRPAPCRRGGSPARAPSAPRPRSRVPASSATRRGRAAGSRRRLPVCGWWLSSFPDRPWARLHDRRNYEKPCAVKNAATVQARATTSPFAVARQQSVLPSRVAPPSRGALPPRLVLPPGPVLRPRLPLPVASR